MADDTDFVRRLRMNNIFPTAGFNPLQAPERPGLDINGILNSVSAMQTNARNADMIQQDNLMRQSHGAHLQEIARQNALQQQARDASPLRAQGGMNVQLGGTIHTPSSLDVPLDVAEARRFDPYFKDESAPNYKHPDDLPGSQTSLLERGKQVIDANKGAAKSAAEAATNLEAVKQRDKLAQISATGEQNRLRDKEKPIKPDNVAIRQEADRKAKSAQQRETQKGMAKDTLDAIDEVMDKNGKLTSDAQWATGVTGIAAPYALGTGAKSAAKKLDHIESRSILNLIGELKSQSRTGATGFGNMSNKDLKVIEDAANRLDRTGSQDEYEKQLGLIRDKLRLIMEDAPEEGSIIEGPKDKVKLTPAELIKKHGG